jgi:phosphate transport system protein
MSTRHTFEAGLAVLHEEMIRMVTLVEQSIEQCIDALRTQNAELARRIIDGDDAVDEQEHRIEKLCLELIATQSPLAKDLRTIGAALKIITDLERIADHASDISEITIRMRHEKYIKPLIDLPKMADLTRAMVGRAIRSFVRQDAAMAMEVCRSDDEVDALFTRIVTELAALMKEDPRAVDQAIDLLLIAKYFERMADHATNIGEWVVYSVSGEHKHLA